MGLRTTLGRTLQFLLVVHLVRTQFVYADKADIRSKEIEKEEKISTSLKIESGHSRNKTEKESKALEQRDQHDQSVSPNEKIVTSTLISSWPLVNETTPVFGNETNEYAGSELMTPISSDIAQIATEESDDETAEELPEALELRYLRPTNRRRISFRPVVGRPSLNRRNVLPDQGAQASVSRPSRRPTDFKRAPPTDKECTFFTKTVCLQAANYPHEAILRSIRSNQEMVSALLTDYKVEEAERIDEISAASFLQTRQEPKHRPRYESRFENNEIRRKTNVRSTFDNVEEGFTCPSQVKYARPQLARAASGSWKYIINTGEHTQTLRLEKCSTPQSSCSFISENYRSSCVQVYNYHRLLTWDNKLGLHMDIFKIPTCCSCHVHGYAELFPPHQNDPPPKITENFPGVAFSTLGQKDELVDIGISNVDTIYGSSNKKPIIDTSLRRPEYPIRGSRPKKPGSSVSRPYDKIPQQHAPNTRAPGYKGPILKSPRPTKYNSRPYRRESNLEQTHEIEIFPDTNVTSAADLSSHDDEIGSIANLQNSFSDEYQEPNRRINYNYHPIIDFFKPEAAMLQSQSSSTSEQESLAANSDAESWKPIVFS